MVAEASVETHVDGKLNGALKAAALSTPSSIRAPESDVMTLTNFCVTEKQMNQLGLADASPLARMAGVKTAEAAYVVGQMRDAIRSDTKNLRTTEVLDLAAQLEAVARDFRKLLTPQAPLNGSTRH